MRAGADHRTVPEAQRPRALAVYTAGFAVGGALGALLAGVLIGRFGWSAVFWFRAPAAVLAFILALTLPATRRAGMERFDIPGALLLVATITVLLLALNQIRHPAFAATLAIITALGVWGFIERERRLPHPIIDIGLFRDGGFAAVNLGNLLINLAGFAVPLLVPFQLSRLPGASVALDGLLLALSSIGMMLGAPLAGRLAAHLPGSWMLLAGSVLIASGLAGIALWAGQAGWLAAAMLVQGIGQGLFQVAYFDLLTTTMPVRNRGVAGSLGMLTRMLGVVSGASLLILAFETLRGTAPDQGGDIAFLSGFRGAMLCAAGLAGLVAVGLLRSLGRARNT